MQGLQGGTGGQESLAELGLVPQSLLMIKWDEEEMNCKGPSFAWIEPWLILILSASSFSAPLKDELRKKSEQLPPPAVKETSESGMPVTTAAPDEAREKKIPKYVYLISLWYFANYWFCRWLQKGLLKKK